MIHTSDTSNTIESSPEAGMDKQRNRIFNWIAKRRRAPASRNKPGDETATTVSEADNDSISSAPFQYPSSSDYDATDPLGATYEILPDNMLHRCLNLLSSDDLDLNRLGLQRLNLLISSRFASDSYGSGDITSFVLVFGGPLGSLEELLRFVFVTMICDAPQTNCDHADNQLTIRQTLSEEEEALENWILEYDPSGESSCDEYDARDDGLITRDLSQHSLTWGDSERAWPRSQGKAKGLFHNHALKILANALGAVYAVDPSALARIPLHCSLWRGIVMSLVGNIESNHSANATLYSIKILRILSFVHPNTILPLVRYNLFPVLVHLENYGERHEFLMISAQASKLLKHATRSTS